MNLGILIVPKDKQFQCLLMCHNMKSYSGNTLLWGLKEDAVVWNCWIVLSASTKIHANNIQSVCHTDRLCRKHCKWQLLFPLALPKTSEVYTCHIASESLSIFSSILLQHYTQIKPCEKKNTIFHY